MNNTIGQKSRILTPLEKPNGFINSIHFSNFLDMGFGDIKEVNLWLDSIIHDPNCLDEMFSLTALFSPEEKTQISSKIPLYRKMSDSFSDEDIKKFPSFSETRDKYINKLLHKKTMDAKENSITTKKEIINNLNLPEDLLEKKKQINDIEQSISGLKAKGYNNSEFFLDVLRKKPELSAFFEVLLLFILRECENKIVWKEYEKFSCKGGSVIDFCKQTRRDYSRGNDFQNKFNTKKNKFNEQKTKLNQKVSSTISNQVGEILASSLSIEEIQECEQFALQDYKQYLATGNNETYSNNDLERIHSIQTFLRYELKEHTSPLLPKEHFLQGDLLNISERKQGAFAEKKGSHTILDKVSYQEVMNQYAKARKMLLEKESEDLKGFIFDRLVEIVTRYLIEFKLSKEFKQHPDTYGAFDLVRTNILDDTYAGADYYLILKTKDYEGIAFIDGLVADINAVHIDNIEDITSIQSDKKIKIMEKLQKASIPKECYGSYIEIFNNLPYENYTIPKTTREVYYENAALIYALMAEVFKNPEIIIEDEHAITKMLQSGSNIFERIEHSNVRNKLEMIKQHKNTNHHLLETLI